MADFRPCGLGKPRSLALSVPLVPWILIPVWVRVWVRIRENPKVIFPLEIACLRAGKEISARLRERAEPVKTRGTKRPARSQHHWPVCGFRRRSKEIPPVRSQASLGTLLRALREAAIPCAKSAESDRFHDPSQRPDFPAKPRTTQGSEAKQEKALTLYAPGRSLPPAVRAVFSGLRMALFSPAPSPDDAFSSGNHNFPHWEGVSPDASRLFRSRK